MTHKSEAKNIWSEESMKNFLGFTFDPKLLLDQVQKHLNSLEPFEFIQENFQGLSNSNFLIKNIKDTYFLRVKSKDSDGIYFNTPEREYSVLKLLQDNHVSFSPKVYYFDNSQKIISKTFMVCEYLRGKVDPNVDCRLIAKALKKLHSIKVSDLKGDTSFLKVDEKFIDSDEELIPYFGKLIENWIREIGKNVLSQEEYQTISDLYQNVIEKTKQYLPKRKYLPRDTIVHRDAHPLNFLLKDGETELTILDWELCHLNHKTVDIVYYTRTLSDEDEKVFMDIYQFEDSEENRFAIWLQFMEQLIGAIGFYINIYDVAKKQNISLPNIGDHVSIKKKLDHLINKLIKKINSWNENKTEKTDQIKV